MTITRRQSLGLGMNFALALAADSEAIAHATGRVQAPEDAEMKQYETIRTVREDGVLFATFDSPPLNLIGPELVRDLVDLLEALEHDPDVRVVIFGSADAEFFLSHVDVKRVAECTQETARLSGSASGSLGGLFRRLSEMRQITIARIEGYARGAGNEFAAACDMRFASRERAVFGQIEAGIGTVPGAGAMQHLTRLLGRGRAMEVLLSSGDYEADIAERYGWINRAMPHAELGPFVSTLAKRIARFPSAGPETIKRRINDISLPALADVRTDDVLFQQTINNSRVASRTKELLERGMQTRGPLERGFADAIGQLKT